MFSSDELLLARQQSLPDELHGGAELQLSGDPDTDTDMMGLGKIMVYSKAGGTHMKAGSRTDRVTGTVAGVFVAGWFAAILIGGWWFVEHWIGS